jgi:hypothetical protein
MKLVARNLAIALALSALSLAGGCVSGSGNTAGGSNDVVGSGVGATEAVSQLSRHCLSAPFDPAANEASFRGDADYTQKGAPFEFKTTKLTTFAHKTSGMEGSAGLVFGAPNCSVTFKPNSDLTDAAIDAAIQLAALAGTSADPFGLKGQGFIIMKYKAGNLTLKIDRKSSEILMSLSKN